jgi:hypothetical protein
MSPAPIGRYDLGDRIYDAHLRPMPGSYLGRNKNPGSQFTSGGDIKMTRMSDYSPNSPAWRKIPRFIVASEAREHAKQLYEGEFYT